MPSRKESWCSGDPWERQFDAANEPKQLLVLRGDHNTGFLLSANRYRQGIDEFLSELANLK